MSLPTIRSRAFLCASRIRAPAYTCTRCASTAAIPPQADIIPPGISSDPIESSTSNPSPKRARPLTTEERNFLSECLRVNQAGELGANLIYSGQYAILRHDPRLKPVIRHMWDQEVHHLSTFNHLLSTHRVRPTVLRPLWNVAGYTLGLTTALLGEKAAMACTEAVETEIGTHYNDQLRVLLRMMKEGDIELEPGSELGKLVGTIREFRDDELEHLDTAVAHDAKGAEGYEVLSKIIRGGCKAAIWLSKRF